MLIGFDFNEQEQEAYVLDWGHREGYLMGKRNKPVPERFVHTTNEESEEAYVASMVELRKFISDPRVSSGYSLPEIVIPGRINAESIRVSEIQPEIERLIEFSRENPSGLKMYRDTLGHIPELHDVVMKIDSMLADREGGLPKC